MPRRMYAYLCRETHNGQKFALRKIIFLRCAFEEWFYAFPVIVIAPPDESLDNKKLRQTGYRHNSS